MPIINFNHITKTYKTHKKQEGLKNSVKDFFHRQYVYNKAVDDVSFSIEKGSIIGLLGENGAGKTTILKLLAGVLYPNSGTVHVNSFIPTDRKKEFLKNISFIMGNKREVNWDLPAIDAFRYQQLVYEVQEVEYKLNLKLLSSLLNVEHHLSIQLRRLSLGERMKMEIINGFLYSPSIVFLDEPTIGLDLKSQIAIQEFIINYRKEKDTTIIITSHYMDDIEQTCDRVILLNNGKIDYDGDINFLKSEGVPFKDKILNMMEGGA